MKTILLTLAMIFAIPQALAVTDEGLKIDVTPVDGGAWVQLTKNGKPIKGAIVNNTYLTPESGRVFVHVSSEPATSAKFVATTPDKNVISTHAFIPRQ